MAVKGKWKQVPSNTNCGMKHFLSFARGIVFFLRIAMISKSESESSGESFDSFLGTPGRLQRVVTFLWMYLYPD